MAGIRIAGSNVLLTGASSGIGRELAKELGTRGVRLVITARRQALLDTLAEEVGARGGPTPVVIAADLSQRGAAQVLAAEAEQALGRIDILVNNAGTTQRASLEDLTTAQWDDVVDTNLRGTWLCSQAAASHLRASKRGRIINIASMFAHVGMPNRTPYVASKGGVVALTRALAVELAADAVTVNAICPGPFMTSMHDAAARSKMLEAIPLGRWGDPDELGPAVVYLASDAGAYMTGATLTLDGGYTAR